MEADWEIEIAPDAPVIDGAWDGLIDLRTDATRVAEIDEAVHLPALAQALVRLNAISSPVWTAKCDVWPLASFDPDEMDADPDATLSALGCYIDLLPVKAEKFSTLDVMANWGRRLCQELRAQPLRQCRVDAVIRRAFLTPEEEGLGVTAYVAACGWSESDATTVLAHALAVLVDSVLAVGCPDSEAY